MSGKDEESSASAVIGRLAVRITLTALMVLVIFIAAKNAYDFGRDVFYQVPVDEEPGKDIEVELYSDTDLSASLKEAGLIRNEKAFYIMTKVYKVSYEPGTYTLNTSLSTKELLKSISGQSTAIANAKEQPELTDESVLSGGDEEG